MVAAEQAGTFQPPPSASTAAQPWEMGAGDPVTARLLVDADQAGWAVGHVGADAVEERREDGSVVLAVRVTNRPAFRSFVLGFLDHAEVLGPPELRDDMVVLVGGPVPKLSADDRLQRLLAVVPVGRSPGRPPAGGRVRPVRLP